jgi:hypothetical protein
MCLSRIAGGVSTYSRKSGLESDATFTWMKMPSGFENSSVNQYEIFD